MATRLHIDGVDVLATYGAYPVGCEGLVAWPELKAVQIFDWPDEDGVEANLSSPILASRQFSMPCVVRDGRISEFLDFIYTSHTHTYEVPELSYKRVLRLIDCTNFEIHGPLGFATLVLSDDTPLSDYVYQAPASTINLASQYGWLMFDGVDASEYGCVALDGLLQEMKAAVYGQVKEALLIDVCNRDGVEYDIDAPVKKSARTINIPLYMRCADMGEFWRNSNAFLYDLSRVGTHTILYQGTSICGYYGSMSVKDFGKAPDKVWLEFDITFNITTIQ